MENEDLVPSPEEFQPRSLEGGDARQKRDIVQHFLGKPVSADALTEYCNLKGYAPMTLGKLEEATLEWEHEQRAVRVIPLICAELAKWRYNRGIMTEDELRAANAENEKIETRICEILEDGGFVYQDIDVFTIMLINSFSSVFQRAGQRINNMCSAVMAEDAKEKYGKTIPVKALAEEHRRRFKSKRTE